MMHKLSKTILHLWITLASFAAFGISWAFVAHAQKPTPLVEPQVQLAAPTQAVLEPFPSLQDLLNTGSVQTQSFSAPTIVMPRMRSGGS
jgi:hypothetical protein